MLGAIETGGTKFVCAVGNGPDDLRLAEVPTTTPEATVAGVIGFFRAQPPIDSLGIASFGPIDRRPGSPAFGRITSTPKANWRNYDIVGTMKEALGVVVGFDTDVNAAVLAEARWGAGRELTDLIYLTVGTGIGGGAMVNRQLLHGLIHPEMGHMPIPHDRTADPFSGCCPYHGDCLEGLASGPALEARWDAPGEALPSDHPAWALEARYLALALMNLVCAFSPQRIILGGGVMQQARLFDLVRAELAQRLNGYIQSGDVVPAQLGRRAGVLGALILAEQALY